MEDHSLSVIKLKDILLVTIPSEPDDETIHILQNRVLGAIEKHESKGLILDISQVEILDSFFARTISETSQMVTLMGGKTVIAGMRPSVAITAIQLGLGVGEAYSALDVDRALDLLETQSKRID